MLRETWLWLLCVIGMGALRYFSGEPFYPTAPELDWVVFAWVGLLPPLGILCRSFRGWPLGQDWM
jgi:hypothetical protein